MRRRRTLSKQEMDYRLKRLDLLGPWYGRAMVTLATAVPIGVATWLLQPFAGETTSLQVSAVATLSFAASGMMGASVWRKSRAMKEQRAELNRLRGLLGGTLDDVPPKKRR